MRYKSGVFITRKENKMKRKVDQHNQIITYGDPIGIILKDEEQKEHLACIYSDDMIILDDGTLLNLDLTYDRVWDDIN